MEGRQKSWPLCLLDMYLLLDYNWTIAGARFTQCREVNRELRGQWQLLFYFGCVFENNIDKKKIEKKIIQTTSLIFHLFSAQLL